MILKKSIIFISLVSCFLLSGCASKKEKMELTNPNDPITLNVWTYYNDQNLVEFNKLVDEYNETEGKMLGIKINSVSYGSIDELEKRVLEAVESKEERMPNIFLTYSAVAYKLDKMGIIEDISEKFTKEDIELYVDNYIEEGAFNKAGEIKIFPTAKSTEILWLNKTDWDKFSNSVGVDIDKLSTIEGIVEVAKMYYDWTDSLTKKKNDGKAFFGYDALDNYFINGAMQLGCEIFDSNNGKLELNFEANIIQKLWDNYYIPCIKGYFYNNDEYNSSAMARGDVIAYVGSSAGALFFPKSVTNSEGSSYDIQMQVLESPYFDGGENYKVQQGAGMAVSKGTEREVYASTRFLKWFTETKNNVLFSINSGYLPVTKEGNNLDYILSSNTDEITKDMEQVITVGINSVNDYELYTPNECLNGSEMRNILKTSLKEKAKADYEAIKNGESIDKYLSKDNFYEWYEQVLKELNSYIVD